MALLNNFFNFIKSFIVSNQNPIEEECKECMLGDSVKSVQVFDYSNPYFTYPQMQLKYESLITNINNSALDSKDYYTNILLLIIRIEKDIHSRFVEAIPNESFILISKKFPLTAYTLISKVELILKSKEVLLNQNVPNLIFDLRKTKEIIFIENKYNFSEISLSNSIELKHEWIQDVLNSRALATPEIYWADKKDLNLFYSDCKDQHCSNLWDVLHLYFNNKIDKQDGPGPLACILEATYFNVSYFFIIFFLIIILCIIIKKNDKNKT